MIDLVQDGGLVVRFAFSSRRVRLVAGASLGASHSMEQT